jgi:general secretion pathway protein H
VAALGHAALGAAGDRSRGFTLLELMVVIVLAGILLSLVTVNVTPDARQQLARDAQRIGQLFALAADESRIRQQPIFWEADLNGYRFVTVVRGERQLVSGDDLLRERPWQEKLQSLALFPSGSSRPSQIILGPGAPPVTLAIAREWVQPAVRLELATAAAKVAIDFDERGRGTVQLL